jgi:hypothetical protein
VGEHGDWPSDHFVQAVVEGFASIAVRRGQPDAAARLLGAADAWRRFDNVRLERWEQGIHDRTLAAAQAQLSTDDFIHAFTAGTKLTLDEAVGYAHATNVVQAERE